MIFIDGTWLYTNTPRLAELTGKPEYHIDFGLLPRVLKDILARLTDNVNVDLVRTYLFGSYAHNFDRQDNDAVQRRLDFFNMLREEHHYEVDTFPINFMGRRLRKIDREPNDNFESREKCVDIAMATQMVSLAAYNSYDIAICILGDSDFKPALQEIRRMGKRVMIVSISSSCSGDIANSSDPQRIKDFDVVWLDKLADDIQLVYAAHERQCESPYHIGERMVMTTFHPRRGQRFYCDACRSEFQSRQRGVEPEPIVDFGEPVFGKIKKIVFDRGYGFVESSSGDGDYFFHAKDLSNIQFSEITDGMHVSFKVERRPTSEKSGKAANVIVEYDSHSDPIHNDDAGWPDNPYESPL